MANNKPASAYAKPHTMSGKSVTVVNNPGSGKNLSDLKNRVMSTGHVSTSMMDEVKTSGIQVRGGKAQTKGKMARGPMA
jgi:glucosamine 6-phosphate synthetase-like amidotransferase/phosphosugar isomerase protein